MQDNKAFKEAYKKLNKAQKEAVDSIEGPVMVIAGPGTGKTQILTLRIANILEKTDVGPGGILALTFTESGARAMRERLRTYIGSEAYRVPIHTFHGFAEMLIREYPDAYTRVIGGRIANDIEQVEMIESILETGEYRVLRPIGNPAYYVSALRSIIAELKKENINPDDLQVIIDDQEKELLTIQKIHEKGAHEGKVRSEYHKKEKAIAKNKELHLVYRSYHALMDEKRRYDYNDMIIETIRALENNEDMLRDLQEAHQYILADEHQDVNGAQNRILELLASYHESPNLFVVGDEKQAIYRFQGASLENFLYFEDHFLKTHTVALTQNYRSGQSILDAAHSLIHTDEGPAKDLRIPLQSVTKKTSSIERRDFSHQAVEDEWLVSSIQSLLESGVEPEEVAIVFRTNKEVEAAAYALRKAGVHTHASADGDILTHPITNAVRELIRAVSIKQSNEALFAVLQGTYWGIDTEDIVRVLAGRNVNRSLLDIISNRNVLEELGVKNVQGVYAVFRLLEDVRAMETTLPPHRVLEHLLTKSGFLAHVMEHDPIDGGRVLRRVYDEIEGMVHAHSVVTLGDVSVRLNRLREHSLALTAPYIRTIDSAVQVMTAHKAKGLEFQHVYIPHLSDSGWGGRRSVRQFDITLTKHIEKGAFDAQDDERRLLYVALTRAKTNLYLSVSGENREGRGLIPSRFFDDIADEYIARIPTEKEDETFKPTTALQASPQNTDFDTSILKTTLLERGISATGLNNYLRSPWDYFYRNVLRIPEVQPLPMLYGTALHGVLERVTKTCRETGITPKTTELSKLLAQELGRLAINKEEYATLHARGLESLVVYLDHLVAGLPENAKEELRLKVVLQTGNPIIPEVPLSGMLDRIDFDTKGKAVRVIDYKTGKPRTRGYIEGATKDSNGDYKRQLVFYALLLSLYDEERYRTREGTLSFVEADSKGKIHEEAFSITESEIEALRTDIIRVVTEIVQGSFLHEPCDPNVSAYCDLAEVLLR